MRDFDEYVYSFACLWYVDGTDGHESIEIFTKNEFFQSGVITPLLYNELFWKRFKHVRDREISYLS